MEVEPVRSRSDLRRFIEHPYRRYRGHPQWVPPLRVDEWSQFDAKKNPALEHLEIELFLARRDRRTVGRIGAIINSAHDRIHADNVAFFGYFEAEDARVAAVLLESAEDWALARGRSRIRGPVNPTLNDPCGFQIDGFDHLPFLLTPYTPPDYPSFVEGRGFGKIKDLLAWRIDIANVDLGRLGKIADRIEKRQRIRLRRLDLDCFDREAETILEIYRSSWADNWGFVPPTAEEFAVVAKQMRMILEPDLVRFAEVDDRAVGFSVTLPDINPLLKRIGGRLLPFGVVHLLLDRKRLKRARMPLLGVLPEFRHRGIFAPPIVDSIRQARNLGFVDGDCSWTLEENHDIAAAIEAAGGRHYKTFRIYQKAL